MAYKQNRREDVQSTLQFPSYYDSTFVLSRHTQAACGDTPDGTSRTKELLHSMQELEATKDTPLFYL